MSASETSAFISPVETPAASGKPQPLLAAGGPSDSNPGFTLTKSDLRVLLSDVPIGNLKDNRIDARFHDSRLRVDTSLDPSLQQFLLKQLEGSISRQTGIVVLEAETGRILAMAGFDKTSDETNPCVESQFPAASIFKIVTAAAALETCGLDPNSTLTFNGGKYTLYKSQLQERVHRHTSRVTLEDAFAQSINPVFGKLGALRLGPEVLNRYGDAFGFNRRIDFEMALAPSHLKLTGDAFEWAEVASGFNRRTTLSPMHGALISAAILNRGRMPQPTIIDSVVDQNGIVLYKREKSSIGRMINPETCDKVQQLMQGTVRSGTSRKAFRGFQKDRILSRLVIGGKTGSINNQARDARIDWFVGFAEEKNGRNAIALAIVVAHEDLIGTKASAYARMAITHYFNEYFSAHQAPLEKNARG